MGWRDVSNKEFYIYNPIVQSISNIQLAEKSQKGMHGIVYGDTFRICDPDPDTRITDRRKRKKGKMCSTFSCERLKFILATMNTLPSDDIVEMDRLAREKRQNRAPRRKRRQEESTSVPQTVPSEFASDLTEEQKEIYMKWDNMQGLKVSTLCSIVKNVMAKENRVLYYNIKMT